MQAFNLKGGNHGSWDTTLGLWEKLDKCLRKNHNDTQRDFFPKYFL